MSKRLPLRKSIKIRVFTGLVILMTVYVIGLLAYFQLRAFPQIFAEVDAHREGYAAKLGEVARNASNMADDSPKLKSYLAVEAKNKGIQLILYDSQGRLAYETEPLPTGSFAFRVRQLVYNQNQAFLLEGKYPLEWSEFAGLDSVGEARLAVIAGLLLVSILIILFLHLALVSPLTRMAAATREISASNLNDLQMDYYKKDELGELARSFENLAHQLAWSQEQQQELISAVAHDLKGPLTSIIGYSERLASGRTSNPDQIGQYLEIISSKARLIENLTNEFSEINSLEGPAFQLNKTPANVLEYFTEIINHIQKDADVHDFDFNAFLDEIDDSIEANIDPARMQRVFDNITANARKYAHERLELQLRLTLDSGGLLCSISDNGPGVPGTDLEKIFERSYRVEKSRSRDKGGSGLGLYICKQIISAHGGRISAANNQGGKGLTISFSIPLQTN